MGRRGDQNFDRWRGPPSGGRELTPPTQVVVTVESTLEEATLVKGMCSSQVVVIEIHLMYLL
jgi:hypothetical protein